MSYVSAVAVILVTTILSVIITALIQRHVPAAFRRRHHDVGSVVFLQLGVVFAVLLAFVFSEAWDEYNAAAQAIDLEVGAMHGAAMIAATLPHEQAKTILEAEQSYLTSVVDHEWAVMAEQRRESRTTDDRLITLVTEAANLALGAARDDDKKNEVLSLLSKAHEERETRIFQATNGIPVPLWDVLIGIASILSLFVSFSAIEHKGMSIALSACFVGSIVSILVIARLLDYPFEGALALRPTDFIAVAGKIDDLVLHCLHG
ncbi:MAG: hypothetical protein ACRYGI_06200 [Janthinobacterium lividum]